jgi:hypothetical protein
MRRSDVKTEGRNIRRKESMKIYDIIHVSALMDDQTRPSSRHKYRNKEGNQAKKGQ